MPRVSDSPLTPELALAYLAELSTDIRAAVVIDAGGTLRAHSGVPDGAAEQVAEQVRELFDQARQAGATGQFEVTLPEGALFVIEDQGWTLAVVAGRYALSSLMFYDLRMVARDLAGVPA